MPKDLPNARILTYGYDTMLPGSKSNAQISEYANQFLESLKHARQNPHRPILFIGHSLGGLLIKEVRIIVIQTIKKDRRLSGCYRLLYVMLTVIFYNLAMESCFLESRTRVLKIGT